MTDPILHVSGLVAGYGGLEALHGVDLHVAAGEIVCLIGRNGAGKTTLLKTIAGLLPARAGRIRLQGRDVTAWPVQRRHRAGLASVPEGRRVFASLTVRDNLLVGGYGRPRRALTATLDDVYGRFPRLAERSEQPAGTLSGGEQQMLAIGRALMSGPAVILLDEPSLGLAPQAVARVGAVISALRGTRAAVLLVEQNADVAFRLAARGYLLERGRIRASATSAALRRDPRVRSAYLGTESGLGKTTL
ncbi:ABC transporter ATP-binding protein [Actinoplanes sp. NPDC049596]|uniref:ABC transporter ATP-binding protein n=1 Tax=unclassified Actinoplanes TaxID=2626549 RepID=UPI00343B82C6